MINVPLEEHQEEYQPTMVEFEGKVFNQPVCILIDPGASVSYLSPKIIENFHLQATKFKNPWLVQLATRVNKRVTTKVDNYHVVLVVHPITRNFNLLPLGSYDILIGIEWMEKQQSLINYRNKIVSFFNKGGVRQEVKRIKRPLKLNPIISSLEIFPKKGCKIYVV